MKHVGAGISGQSPARVLEFLRQPENYPERPTRVDLIETHMSWVFLLDRHVYKLKKPVRRPFLDFRTLEARKRFCHEEVRLNRRLAPDVYLGAVPLNKVEGRLSLGGKGTVVDWLVRMRRLPTSRMLDRVIEASGPTRAELDRLSRLLVAFYRSAPRRFVTQAQYLRKLRREIELNSLDLTDPRHSARPGLVRWLGRMHRRFIERHRALLCERVRAGHMLEIHGDLRPEHVCLESMPLIIDRLEFAPTFRILDPADELSYLAMECERLGNTWVGARLMCDYSRALGDHVPGLVIEFYKSLRACQRARLAVLHIHDDSNTATRARWLARAADYLALGARHARGLDRHRHASASGGMSMPQSWSPGFDPEGAGQSF